MCSCGNEDGCIDLENGCRCVCHAGEVYRLYRLYQEALRDIAGRIVTAPEAANVARKALGIS